MAANGSVDLPLPHVHCTARRHLSCSSRKALYSSISMARGARPASAPGMMSLRALDFERRALSRGVCGGNSVCPPYMLVSYAELFRLLQDSPLITASSLVVVEYPKAESKSIADELGDLVKLRDRRYGRTNVAIYGPPTADMVPDD